MILSINQNGEITQNNVLDMQPHYVEEYYTIVPRYWAIDSFGVVNSKKPIKVTEENSLMCYDQKEKNIVLRSISEYLKEPKRYFLMLRAPENDLNKKAVITDTEGNEYTVNFDYITGFMLVIYLKQLAGIDNIISTRLAEFIDAYEEDWSQWFNIEYEFYKKTYNSSLSKIKLVDIKENSPFKIFMDTIIMNDGDKYTVANEIFYSTNINFIIGVLEALINSEEYMTHEIGELITHEKLNPSIYTNCLNILFANYNITKAQYLGYPSQYTFSIRYKVSPMKYDMFRISANKIKKTPFTRFIDNEGKMVIDTWVSRDEYRDGEGIIGELQELKYNDKIKFLRFDELIVVKVRSQEPEPLYDLIMGNGSATNYLLGCSPWAKNSDGDVLAAMGILTKEGLKAAEKIMMSNEERLREGTNPDLIRNWIQKDAVVGLYQATKDV